MFAQILLNTMWDIYRSDCSILVRSEWDTKPPMVIKYVEHQSYHEGKIIVDKVINNLCWHPFWTGIAIIAYTQHAKNEYLIGPKTYDEVHRQHSAYETSFKELITYLCDILLVYYMLFYAPQMRRSS
jgi:hypothetical protein